jgi:hypothetical protein
MNLLSRTLLPKHDGTELHMVCVLCDVVQALHQSVRNVQNVKRFHGTRRHVT